LIQYRGSHKVKTIVESPTSPMAQPKGADTALPWVWVGAALLAHTGWGIYPALGRYMQTVSGLPSMSILIVGGMPMLFLMVVCVLPRYGVSLFRSRTIWMLALVVAVRAITNLLAMRFTMAIYVQLITLMTPFIVVALSLLLLHVAVPAYTGRAILLTFIGAVLMMSSEISSEGIRFNLGPSDWIGISLAFTSSIMLAFYMLLVRRTAKLAVPSQVILIFQITIVVLVSLPISLLLDEDWSQWARIGGADWMVVIAYILLVMIRANGLQIASLRHLGAPFVSSLMAWRLVSALLFASLLLGERLASPYQMLGIVIVMATITWYLWQQRKQQKTGAA
jgi:drug/metabolite transporter (DMT)-like permease